MSDDTKKSDIFPTGLDQNPSPVVGQTQDKIDKISQQVEDILNVFRQVLPSNYVAQVKGPFYTLQFQAAAEELARIQIEAQEVFADSIYNFTRPEFLFQILGALVFPDGDLTGVPDIPGDVSYREFLRRMVVLLLQGATTQTIEDGLTLLLNSDASAEVIERGVQARILGSKSAWDLRNQHEFEINISRIVDSVEAIQIGLPEDDLEFGGIAPDGVTPLEQDFGALRFVDLYGFPEEPFKLQRNLELVMRALKPAHTLYDFRYLFQDVVGRLFQESSSWEMTSYYYDDIRKNCLGAKSLKGVSGETLSDRRLFRDNTRSFAKICSGGILELTTGPNSINAGGLEGTSASTDRRKLGQYTVLQVLRLPFDTDVIARPYQTSGGLSGFATVSSGSIIVDDSQDFSNVAEGETITFTTGNNVGTWRLSIPNPDKPTQIQVDLSTLRVDPRMPVEATGQEYCLGVDRLGVQEPQNVESEDVSYLFST